MSQTGDGRMNLRSPAKLALIGLVLAVSGLTWWTYQRTDRQMRQDLLEQAGIVAQSIQLQRVNSLEGAETDETNPNYLKLKNQLIHLRHANPRCRFLYILGKKEDGTIFFYVDSEPTGSKDESPPGQTYDEAPAAFHEVFETGKEEAVGPVTDRWGSWVTALVPMVQPDTGRLKAVLCMDTDAAMWKWEVLSKVFLYIGLGLVLVFVIGSMWFAVRRFESVGEKRRFL